MATKYWIGRAQSVAQITKVVFSSIVATNTYSVTINDKTVSVTAAGTSLGDLIDALVNAWNSSGEPEHRELIAARREDPTLSGLQLTASTAGVPCTVTASATTGTATVTHPAVASGPNFWNLAGNWLGGTLPAAADDIVVRDSSVSILYGLTDANNYASLKIESTFTGTVGLPDTSSTGYPEYRTTRLTLGTGSAIAVDLGYGVGPFSSRVRLDLQGSNVTYTVSGAGSNFGAAYPFELRNPGAGSTVRVYAGGVVVNSSTTGAVAALDVIQRDSAAVAPTVSIDPAITCTTIRVNGGTLLLEGSATTLTARERAQVTVARAAAVGTVHVGGQANINWDTTGGITTKLFVEQNGTIDFGRVGTARTVAACDMFANGTIKDPLDTVTFTAGIILQACRLGDVELDLGVGITVNG